LPVLVTKKLIARLADPDPAEAGCVLVEEEVALPLALLVVLLDEVVVCTQPATASASTEHSEAGRAGDGMELSSVHGVWHPRAAVGGGQSVTMANGGDSDRAAPPGRRAHHPSAKDP
jgi:hypothetical protein